MKFMKEVQGSVRMVWHCLGVLHSDIKDLSIDDLIDK